MRVTLDLERDDLIALAAKYSDVIAKAEADLASLRANRDAIEAVLSPVRTTTVTSSDGLRRYRVTATAVDPSLGFGLGAKTYTCSCPSFQYQRGLDERSRCKHIRKAAEEGL